MNINPLILGFAIIAITAHASLPLTIDDLTADKNRFRLESNISYANTHHQSLADNGYSMVDLGNGRGIALPNPVSQTDTNSDTLIAGIGVRYGLSDKMDLGIKANGIYHNQRLQNMGQFTTHNHTKLQDINITGQYQLIDNHKALPNTLVFGELSVYDNTQNIKPKALSSILLGATAYTVNDPIVLSLSSAYQYNKERITQSQNRLKLGDVWSINGLVGFAVNPDITLTGGVGVQVKQADKLLGQKIENTKTQTNLNLGLAYALSERSNLTANVRSNLSGERGSVLSLGITTKLGALPEPLSQKYKQLKSQTAK